MPSKHTEIQQSAQHPGSTDTATTNLVGNPDLITKDTRLSVSEKFGSLLVGELPRCPECSKLFKIRTLKQCEYCGFSYRKIEKLFSANQLPPLEHLLDFSNILEKGDEKCILKAIAFLKKRYPQFIPKVLLLPLKPEVELHQIALWMINQCPSGKGEVEQDKHWYVLLLVDTSSNRSCLAYGYQAEIFIPYESSFALMSEINQSLRKCSVRDSVEEFFAKMVSILDNNKLKIERKFKHFKKNS